MHLVLCQLWPEEIGHDERRADREEVRWREPCERVTHALPDLPAWPVRIGSGRRGQQSERPGGHPEGSATRDNSAKGSATRDAITAPRAVPRSVPRALVRNFEGERKRTEVWPMAGTNTEEES